MSTDGKWIELPTQELEYRWRDDENYKGGIDNEKQFLPFVTEKVCLCLFIW